MRHFGKSNSQGYADSVCLTILALNRQHGVAVASIAAIAKWQKCLPFARFVLTPNLPLFCFELDF